MLGMDEEIKERSQLVAKLALCALRHAQSQRSIPLAGRDQP